MLDRDPIITFDFRVKYNYVEFHKQPRKHLGFTTTWRVISHYLTHVYYVLCACSERTSSQYRPPYVALSILGARMTHDVTIVDAILIRLPRLIAWVWLTIVEGWPPGTGKWDALNTKWQRSNSRRSLLRCKLASRRRPVLTASIDALGRVQCYRSTWKYIESISASGWNPSGTCPKYFPF